MKKFLYPTLCTFIIAVTIFDCLASLATAEELANGAEDNPIWALFLETNTVDSLVNLKLLGSVFAGGGMCLLSRSRLKYHVIVPIAVVQLWLFATLNWGTGQGLFSFDLDRPFELISLIYHVTTKG